MKQIYLIILCAFLLFACDSKPIMPQPTDETVVREGMEENEQEGKGRRELWLELLHGGKNSKWDSIEHANTLDMLEYKAHLFNPNRDGEELLADGNIYGKWIERGSANNSGNVMNACYDKDNDWVYAIGGGGPMFRGNLNGFYWELVNDDIKFESTLLEVIDNASGGKRIIAAISGLPYYSDDEGKTWIKSTGLPNSTTGRQIANSVYFKGKIYILYQKAADAKFGLFYSADGSTYDLSQNMLISDRNKIDLALNSTKDSLYVLERVSTTLARLGSYNTTTNKFITLNDSCNISFGPDKKVNLQVSKIGNVTSLYSYDKDLKLMKSIDMGATYKSQSFLPTSPWGVGVFVAPSKPNNLIYGEVNAYRSNNEGGNWIKVNDWGEYYGNVRYKLHADIMVMREFKDQDEKDFILIGHHGGISKTYDYGKNTENFGLSGLNISQYYDTRTYPADPSWVFAGAQDQGMQRGVVTDEFASDFFQMISGDYGHIEFTNNGQSMWMMYPDGSLSFYDDPIGQRYPKAGYKLANPNSNAWIPQIVVDPHSKVDEAYVCGGNENGKGSHIIKLEYQNEELVPIELPYDFSTTGGSLTAMAISPLNPNLWFAITSNGVVFKSNDKGQTFKKMQASLSNAHYLYGSCILPSALDTNVVYISGSGYAASPVYKSVDAGKTFISIKSGMPSTVAFNIVANEDESKLFAATEAGPFVYIKEKQKWFPLSGVNTPNQTYWSVEYLPATKTVRFATYGRGVWDFDEKTLDTSTKEITASDVKIGPNPTSDIIYIETLKPIDKITVFDNKGKIVSINPQPNRSIDVSNLSTGVYFAKVHQGKNSVTKKFIKL